VERVAPRLHVEQPPSNKALERVAGKVAVLGEILLGKEVPCSESHSLESRLRCCCCRDEYGMVQEISEKKLTSAQINIQK
jgi:hypothetical protein